MHNISFFKHEDGSEEIARGAEANKKLLEDMIQKEQKRFKAIETSRKRAKESYSNQFDWVAILKIMIWY